MYSPESFEISIVGQAKNCALEIRKAIAKRASPPKSVFVLFLGI
jgi:hypothetical protein